jgi:hypothetical protein
MIFNAALGQTVSSLRPRTISEKHKMSNIRIDRDGFAQFKPSPTLKE